MTFFRLTQSVRFGKTLKITLKKYYSNHFWPTERNLNITIYTFSQTYLYAPLNKS